MSEATLAAIEMMEMLPIEEQNLAVELIRRLVRAWDPDYTKLTPAEAAALDDAEQSGFVSDGDIDWDHLEQYQ